jgi:hypothetical protein
MPDPIETLAAPPPWAVVVLAAGVAVVLARLAASLRRDGRARRADLRLDERR